jgi:saccharopine dehydrogenase (NAD+, L-lysine-forming)
MKIGVIREGKTPADSRVTLTPAQCKQVAEDFPVSITVKPATGRCYTNKEYEELEIPMANDLSDCDVLMGVKEVPIEQLQSSKTYFFFSHTIKKQSYNRDLLRACIERDIKLLDYEALTNLKGQRLIAFGKFAGMVGAHNGLMTYGWRTGDFDLPRMNEMHDYAAAVELYKTVKFPSMKIVLTGTGRVSSGAAQVLGDMGIRKVSPEDFLSNNYQEAVYTQLSCRDYAAHKEDKDFVNQHFYDNPTEYKSIFAPYTEHADLMINGIYWDNQAPAFFTQEEMTKDSFNIKVIADVTCDIAPISSIPSTIDSSTIADPIFGFDPKTGKKAKPFGKGIVDMMTIDNLPNELPRDASYSFGNQFITNILPELLNSDSDVIKRATVTENGDLGSHFEYLREYLNGEE